MAPLEKKIIKYLKRSKKSFWKVIWNRTPTALLPSSSFSEFGSSQEVLSKLNAMYDILGITIDDDPRIEHETSLLCYYLLEFAFAKDEATMMAACEKLVNMLKLTGKFRAGVLFSCLLPLIFRESILPSFCSEASELQQSYLDHLLNMVSLFPNSCINS